MKPPVQTSRPSKFSNAQTILYEIDMVRFAAGSLGEPNGWSLWRNLECFLLHFRNLIEFFGKQPKGDNLSIQRPEKIWPDQATRPSTEILRRLRREDLWTKYEVRNDTQVNDKLSRYLQHCTEQRVDGKNWNVLEMCNELEPLMKEFENLLPDKTRPWRNPPGPCAIVVAMQESYSTATPTQAAVLLTRNSNPTEKSGSET
jgi:hypothetical protein